VHHELASLRNFALDATENRSMKPGAGADGAAQSDQRSGVRLLREASGRSDTLFSDDAVALIDQVSRGIPLKI
jgi:type II secretory pathway predicted ATPase ExeA